MRYAKGSVVVNPERDIPLLRQLRNSKFVSHTQLFEFMKLGGFDHSQNSFNWRVKRLIDSGHISACDGVYAVGSAVYFISRIGLSLLEHFGQFSAVLNSNTRHMPHSSQVFHALELNTIQLALERANLLASWQSELEVASFNTIALQPLAKDYDAIVDVWLGGTRARFALEYERTLKNNKQYEMIRAALEQERQLECILYLSSSPDVLIHLIRKFRSVHNVAFAAATAFEKELLDTIVTVTEGRYERLGDVLSPVTGKRRGTAFASS